MNSKKHNSSNLLTTQQSKENLPTQSSSSWSSTSSDHSLKKKNRNQNLNCSQLSTASVNHFNQLTNHQSQPQQQTKSTDDSKSVPMKLDEMQQRSSIRNLRVRKLGHVESSEEEIVYRWLEKNPSFVFEYFVSHATRFMVDQWMLRHNKMNNGIHSSSIEKQQREFRRTNRSASELFAIDRKNSLDPQFLSGNNNHLLMRSFSCCDAPITNKQVSSPMRKISAKQFENSTISLEPIFRTTNEGKLSFLPIDKPLKSISLSPKKHLVNRLSNLCSSDFNRSPTNNNHYHYDKFINSTSQSDQTINRSLIMQTPNEVKLMLDCKLFEIY